MKKIQLHGKYSHLDCLIDDEDYDLVNQYKWYGHKNQRGKTIYAVTFKGLKMHRLVLGLEFGDKREGDHEDHNGLNNQKSNLRIVTGQQNSFNRQPNSNSKYKGVCYHKRDKRWQSQIKVDGVIHFLGNFDTKIQAAERYNEEAIKRFGQYAHLNFG